MLKASENVVRRSGRGGTTPEPKTARQSSNSDGTAISARRTSAAASSCSTRLDTSGLAQTGAIAKKFQADEALRKLAANRERHPRATFGDAN
jgi:hypothetical protein